MLHFMRKHAGQFFRGMGPLEEPLKEDNVTSRCGKCIDRRVVYNNHAKCIGRLWKSGRQGRENSIDHLLASWVSATAFRWCQIVNDCLPKALFPGNGNV